MVFQISKEFIIKYIGTDLLSIIESEMMLQWMQLQDHSSTPQIRPQTAPSKPASIETVASRSVQNAIRLRKSSDHGRGLAEQYKQVPSPPHVKSPRSMNLQSITQISSPRGDRPKTADPAFQASPIHLGRHFSLAVSGVYSSY